VQDVLRQIDEVNSPGELWRVILSFYRAQGFNALAYFIPRLSGGGNIGDVDVVYYGFPVEIVESYLNQGEGRHDPVPRFSMQQGVPMRWSHIWSMVDPDIDQMRFLERMRSLGLGDGYALPVFGPAQRNGNVNIGCAVSEEVMANAPLSELHMIAQAAHIRLCKLMPDIQGPEKPLSARELEILDWVARGKSNGVIAEILELSSGTVDTYLRRIYEKLDVSDRTSAAVRGVGMGLISAD
jgi:DNA-binding CsgD family transcriptional regulator